MMSSASIVRASVGFVAVAVLAVTSVAAQELSIPNLEIGEGSQFTAPILLTSAQESQGFQTAVTYDNTILEFLNADWQGFDIEALLFPETVEFFSVVSEPNLQPGIGWAATGCVFDIASPFEGQTLPPGTNMSIVGYTFDSPGGTSGVCTTLQFVDGLGTPPIVNVITINSTSVLPDLNNGEICFVIHDFIRGDADGNGTFNGLVDALFILAFQFTQGPPPPCLDAGDFDDDGTINGLVEALSMLGFQFSGGPPPAPPGLTCGLDPTADNLGCVLYDACP